MWNRLRHKSEDLRGYYITSLYPCDGQRGSVVMHKSNCGSKAIGFTAAVFVSKGRNHGISRKTEYLRGDYPKDGSGSPGTAGEDVSGGARIRHGYRASNVPKSLCNSASSLSMAGRNYWRKVYSGAVRVLESGIALGEAPCSKDRKPKQILC